MKLGSSASLGAILVCAAASSATAKPQVQVGGCNPNMKIMTNFATIQQAVTAVGANGTVFVCPGTYAEQIEIDRPLTLKGVSLGTGSQPRIVAPASGLTANTSSLSGGYPIAAQIWVHDVSASVYNLTVDGASSGINGCGPDLRGILYQNASGTVSGNAVLNQKLPAGLNGCQSGQGIWVESSTASSAVTISGNVVRDFQKNGITADDTNTTAMIMNNVVVGQGPTSGAAENAIQVGFGAAAMKISGNLVSDVVYTGGDSSATGILVYDGSAPAISANTIDNTQGGIYIYNDGGYSGALTSGIAVGTNKIDASRIYDGIDFCGVSGTISNNVIDGSDESGIHVDSGCGPASSATLSSNTINYACAGVLVGSNSTETADTSQTYINTATNVLTGSDSCPAQPMASSMIPVRRHRPAVRR